MPDNVLKFHVTTPKLEVKTSSLHHKEEGTNKEERQIQQTKRTCLTEMTSLHIRKRSATLFPSTGVCEDPNIHSAKDELRLCATNPYHSNLWLKSVRAFPAATHSVPLQFLDITKHLLTPFDRCGQAETTSGSGEVSQIQLRLVSLLYPPKNFGMARRQCYFPRGLGHTTQ